MRHRLKQNLTPATKHRIVPDVRMPSAQPPAAATQSRGKKLISTQVRGFRSFCPVPAIYAMTAIRYLFLIQ